MVYRVAKDLGKWPGEVAALPLHTWRAVRDAYIRANAPPPKRDDPNSIEV